MMQFSGLEIELRTMDMSSQIPMFTKCTQGEQMPFKLQASGSIFGGAEQNQQGLKVFTRNAQALKAIFLSWN
jgi:hypothetical protein